MPISPYKLSTLSSFVSIFTLLFSFLARLFSYSSPSPHSIHFPCFHTSPFIPFMLRLIHLIKRHYFFTLAYMLLPCILGPNAILSNKSHLVFRVEMRLLLIACFKTQIDQMAPRCHLRVAIGIDKFLTSQTRQVLS